MLIWAIDGLFLIIRGFPKIQRSYKPGSVYDMYVKYIYKGFDAANVEIRERLDHDEVKTDLDTSNVTEAIWRLFEYNMYHNSHTVIRLGVHLPCQSSFIIVKDFPSTKMPHPTSISSCLVCLLPKVNPCALSLHHISPCCLWFSSICPSISFQILSYLHRFIIFSSQKLTHPSQTPLP